MLNDIIINPLDENIYEKVRRNWDSIAKPIDGLGEFEKAICKIAAITGREYPDISKRALIIMCADNGIVEEGVTQTDISVTKAVTELMIKQKSSVGIMSQGFNVDEWVVDIGVNCDKIEGCIDKKVAKGTKNFLKGQAMSEKECLEAVQAGIDVVKQCKENGYSILATGEMGIGNTTTSTAMLCALTGADPQIVTGTGAGLSSSGLERKKQVIEQGLSLHNLKAPANTNSVDGPKGNIADTYAFRALSCVGGFDIAGLAGVFIGAAIYHLPVIIDGFISAVAALTAQSMCPGVKNYMLASHSGRETGTELALNELGIKAYIYADMALGEGTGAIMMFPLLEMAMNLYKSGTGFSDTQIESYERFGQ